MGNLRIRVGGKGTVSPRAKNLSQAGGFDGGLRDWVFRIQAVCAREANNVLELARLVSAARRALPHGGWSKLWRAGEMPIPFSKRKGEMLVVIGMAVEGLNTNNCARLPAAWRTLYYLARLDRQTMEQLIGQGRIHPGLSLLEAKGLLDEYLPEIRRTTSRSKLQVRLARFAAFVRTNLGTWSQQERKMAAEELVALAEKIQAASCEMAAADEELQDARAILLSVPHSRRFSAGANQPDSILHPL